MSTAKDSSKPRCIAITAKGTRCKNIAKFGDYCAVHKHLAAATNSTAPEAPFTPAQATIVGKLKTILARLRLGLRLEIFGIVLTIAGSLFAYYSYTLDRQDAASTEAGQDKILTKLDGLEDRINEIALAAGEDLPPETAEALARDISAYLDIASEKEKRLIDQSLFGKEKPARENAVRVLAQLTDVQYEAAEALNQQNAIRYRAVGAGAFLFDTDLAIKSYERALRLEPEDLRTINQLGHLYQRIGDLPKAEDMYKKISLLAGEDKALQSVSLGNLGLIEGKGEGSGCLFYNKFVA